MARMQWRNRDQEIATPVQRPVMVVAAQPRPTSPCGDDKRAVA